MNTQASLDTEITALEQQMADGQAPRAQYEHLARLYHQAGHQYLQQNQPAAAHKMLARHLRIALTLKERRDTLKILDTLVGDEPLICEKCDRRSPIASAFQLVSRGTRGQLLCPRCLYGDNPASGKGWMQNSLFWVAVLAGLTALTYPLGNDLHFLIANFFLCILFTPIIIILHEAAHALGAMLMRGKVYGFEVGSGRLLWQKRISGCLFTFRLNFSGGRAWFGFPDATWVRVRFLVAVAAPLLMHLVLALWLLSQTNFTSNNTAYVPLQSFALANLFTFLFNLYPRVVGIYGQPHLTDGAYLLKAIQGELKAEELHRAYYLQAVSLAVHEEKYEQALAVVDEGLARYPENGVLLFTRAYILQLSKQESAARRLYQALLARPTLSQRDRAQALNNLAWLSLLQGDPTAALPDAEQAYALVPWWYPMEGTLGAALIENGQVSAGIDLLLGSERATVVVEHQASHYAYLALGYALQDDPDKSRHYWEQAVALAPDEETIAHIRPKLVERQLIMDQ